jgi:predicted PP-loop superfamily ATPase
MRCARCVLSAQFPGISFDERGVCNHCREAGPLDNIEARRVDLRARLDGILKEARADAKGEYQCIVAFSGGKDSSFTLKLLIEHYRLKCLAVTVDNGFLSDQALVNCRLVTDALGVDHELHRPNSKFMKRLYSESISGGLHVQSATQRASAVCNSCIGLINTHMLKLALRLGAPVIAGGYLGGQVPRGAGVMQFTLGSMAAARQSTELRYEQRLGTSARSHMSLSPLADTVDQSARVAVVNPLLAWIVPEEKIVGELSGFGWIRPSDTGLNSSNCRLNDLGVLMHLRQHGFHPYESELAESVRNGSMSRDEALAKLEPPKPQSVGFAAARLGIEV